MDKRTRVLNAMNKLPVDHVPCGFWFHFGGKEAPGEECVQAHLRYYREKDLDFLKVMCDGFFSLQGKRRNEFVGGTAHSAVPTHVSSGVFLFI